MSSDDEGSLYDPDEPETPPRATRSATRVGRRRKDVVMVPDGKVSVLNFDTNIVPIQRESDTVYDSDHESRPRAPATVPFLRADNGDSAASQAESDSDPDETDEEIKKLHGVNVAAALNNFGTIMSGNLLNKVLKHHGIEHLRGNSQPVASLIRSINAETGRGYFGAVKAEKLLGQHARHFPILKVPAELGTYDILQSYEHPLAKSLEKVTVDGFFRRKCDVLAHLIDWEQNRVQTRVEKKPFVKMFSLALTAMDEESVWPLKLLEIFKQLCSKKYSDFYVLESRMLWLAWLLIVEPVPQRYQKGGDREANLTIMDTLFRREEDEILAKPSNKIAGRVKVRNPELSSAGETPQATTLANNASLERLVSGGVMAVPMTFDTGEFDLGVAVHGEGMSVDAAGEETTVADRAYREEMRRLLAEEGLSDLTDSDED